MRSPQNLSRVWVYAGSYGNPLSALFNGITWLVVLFMQCEKLVSSDKIVHNDVREEHGVGILIWTVPIRWMEMAKPGGMILWIQDVPALV